MLNHAKKILFSILLLSLGFNFAAFAKAQENPLLPAAEAQEGGEKMIEPKITTEEFAQVDKKVIFDASETLLPTEDKAEYFWNFGDGKTADGQEVVHQYSRTGKYTVKLTVRQNTEEKSAEQAIFVYDQKAFLIIDSNKEEEINLINIQAAENGTALKILTIPQEGGGFSVEEKLTKQISESIENIKDSNLIIFYAKSPLGLQSFTRSWQNASLTNQEIIKKKFFTIITDGNMDVNVNLAIQSFKIIEPKNILLTRKEALFPLLSIKNYDEITDTLKARGIEYKIIDKRAGKSRVFALSNLITEFISKGVSAGAIYLILLIPFLTCLVIFFRQVIGISSFGVYTPVITAASFYILGLQFGIITFLFAVVTGYLVKFLLNKMELLYLSKVGLNLSFISLSFLAVVWLSLYLNTEVSLSVAIFPILVMSSVAEKFMAAQTEEGFKGALFATLETLLIVVICYYLIVWTAFNNVLMSWPELIILPIIITWLIGKFTGLRLSEYLRFRSLFSEHAEE